MIIIFGMHRSGTSLMSGVLHKCGVDTGTKKADIKKEKKERPQHHYEDWDIVSINDKLLEHCGGEWFEIPEYEKIMNVDDKDLLTMAEKHLLSRKNSCADNMWSVKDPRMSVTFQWWINNFREIMGDVKPIWIKRELKGVVGSLIKRDVWAQQKDGKLRAENLSRTYTQYIERTLNQFHMNCLRLTYEYLLINKSEAFRTVCSYIDINPNGKYRDEALNMINPKLKRN